MRTPSLRLGFKTKLVLLVLAWVAWFVVGGVEVTQAQTQAQCNSEAYIASWASTVGDNGAGLRSRCSARFGVTTASPAATPATAADPVATPPPAAGEIDVTVTANRSTQEGSPSQSSLPNVNTDPNNQSDGPGPAVPCPGCANETAIGAALSNPSRTQTGTVLAEATPRPSQNGGVAAPAPSGNGGVAAPAPSGNGGVQAPAPAAPGRSEPLRNPLSRISTIPDLLSAILTVVIVIAIPIIILFIMLAGFKYVTANGNTGQVKEASTALLYAVIGGVMIIGATAIAQIIKNLVNAFTG